MKSKLLLDEDQQKIFDYIFKPILSYNYIGTRYNGQNLPTKIKEKLIGVTQGKQSATIKNTLDKRLNVYNLNEQNNKKKEKNNYGNYNKILNSDSNENINDENNDDNNNIIKQNENNNEDNSSN